MDLNSIEATSVAIRAGQVAAAELMNLLTREDDEPPRPIEDWFGPGQEPDASLQQDVGRTLERITRLGEIVDKLGGYVCHSADAVSGERLYRWAVHEDLVRRGEWGDLPFGQRQAYDLFALVTRSAHVPLKAEQDRLAAIGAEPPKQLGLALEDSIFEPEESLGKLRPEAVAAAPMIDRYYRETAARRAQEKATKDAARKAKELPPGEWAPKATPKPSGAPLSVGEAAHTPPAPNRGGRPRTK